MSDNWSRQHRENNFAASAKDAVAAAVAPIDQAIKQLSNAILNAFANAAAAASASIRPELDDIETHLLDSLKEQDTSGLAGFERFGGFCESDAGLMARGTHAWSSDGVVQWLWRQPTTAGPSLEVLEVYQTRGQIKTSFQRVALYSTALRSGRASQLFFLSRRINAVERGAQMRVSFGKTMVSRAAQNGSASHRSREGQMQALILTTPPMARSSAPRRGVRLPGLRKSDVELISAMFGRPAGLLDSVMILRWRFLCRAFHGLSQKSRLLTCEILGCSSLRSTRAIAALGYIALLAPPPSELLKDEMYQLVRICRHAGGAFRRLDRASLCDWGGPRLLSAWALAQAALIRSALVTRGKQRAYLIGNRAEADKFILDRLLRKRQACSEFSFWEEKGFTASNRKHVHWALASASSGRLLRVLAVARFGGGVFVDADPLVRKGTLQPNVDSLDPSRHAHFLYNITRHKNWSPMEAVLEAAKAAINIDAVATPSRVDGGGRLCPAAANAGGTRREEAGACAPFEDEIMGDKMRVRMRYLAMTPSLLSRLALWQMLLHLPAVFLQVLPVLILKYFSCGLLQDLPQIRHFSGSAPADIDADAMGDARDPRALIADAAPSDSGSVLAASVGRHQRAVGLARATCRRAGSSQVECFLWVQLARSLRGLKRRVGVQGGADVPCLPLEAAANVAEHSCGDCNVLQASFFKCSEQWIPNALNQGESLGDAQLWMAWSPRLLDSPGKAAQEPPRNIQHMTYCEVRVKPNFPEHSLSSPTAAAMAKLRASPPCRATSSMEAWHLAVTSGCTANELLHKYAARTPALATMVRAFLVFQIFNKLLVKVHSTLNISTNGLAGHVGLEATNDVHKCYPD
ncbi:unnamed protein product, partial [Prorocentrum cordatum]